MSRWIQHPITHELVPRDEYVRPSAQTHAVHGDIQPFISPIDRTLISDRGQLREHMRVHNVTHADDYSPEYLAKKRAEHTNEKGASLERKRTMYETWTRLEREG
jgi:hypothetical protein